MARQIIATGTTANDGTGDPLRTAMDKSNDNFQELYTDLGNKLDLAGGTLTGAIEAPVVQSNKLRFHFDTLADLPDATTYHGMFAHVHDANAAFYAHSGAWVEIADAADIPTTLTDLGIVDGVSGYVLKTDGAGNFTFAAESGGGGSGTGLSSRAAKTTTITNIADDTTQNFALDGYKGYAIYSIETSHAAWVRLYIGSNERTADASRAQTADPAPDAGVVAEVVTTGAQTINFSPAAIGWNTSAGTTISAAITNRSGSTQNIIVTVTMIQLEA